MSKKQEEFERPAALKLLILLSIKKIVLIYALDGWGRNYYIWRGN